MGTKGHLVMWSEGGRRGKLLYPYPGWSCFSGQEVPPLPGSPQTPASGPCPLGWCSRDEASWEPRTDGTQ